MRGGKPGEGVSSSTHSLGPETVAEEGEKKEKEEDSQGEQEGRKGGGAPQRKYKRQARNRRAENHTLT